MMPVLSSPKDFDPALLRHPTEEEKEAELRIYFIVRSDRLPSTGDLCRLAGNSTLNVLGRAALETPEQYLGYFKALAQPKIALRVKSAHTFERAVALAPNAAVTELNGERVFAAFGPVARKDLPDHIRKLQVLSIDTPATPNFVLPKIQDSTAPRLTIILRADANTPYGKLAAQAGHGVWGAVRRLCKENGDPDYANLDFDAWACAGSPIDIKICLDQATLERVYTAGIDAGLNGCFIVDAGRTVFTEPTATLACIGPTRELPDAIRNLPDVL